MKTTTTISFRLYAGQLDPDAEKRASLFDKYGAPEDQDIEFAVTFAEAEAMGIHYDAAGKVKSVPGTSTAEDRILRDAYWAALEGSEDPIEAVIASWCNIQRANTIRRAAEKAEAEAKAEREAAQARAAVSAVLNGGESVGDISTDILGHGRVMLQGQGWLEFTSAMLGSDLYQRAREYMQARNKAIEARLEAERDRARRQAETDRAEAKCIELTVLRAAGSMDLAEQHEEGLASASLVASAVWDALVGLNSAASRMASLPLEYDEDAGEQVKVTTEDAKLTSAEYSDLRKLRSALKTLALDAQKIGIPPVTVEVKEIHVARLIDADGDCMKRQATVLVLLSSGPASWGRRVKIG